MPVGYSVYRLNRYPDDRGNERQQNDHLGYLFNSGASPLALTRYGCDFSSPWSETVPWPTTATTALLPVLSPPDAYHDQWDVLVLSAPFGSDTLHGTPPPDKLLKRMVDPVSKSNDPNAGGLGISASHYMQTAKQYGYQGDRLGNDDKCSWSLPPAA